MGSSPSIQAVPKPICDFDPPYTNSQQCNRLINSTLDGIRHFKNVVRIISIIPGYSQHATFLRYADVVATSLEYLKISETRLLATIKEKVYRSAIIDLQAKMYAINSSLSLIINEKVAEDQMKSEAVSARLLCEETLEIFKTKEILKEDNNVFSSSATLISFAGSSVAVHKFLVIFDEGYFEPMIKTRDKLVDVLNEYKDATVVQRLKFIESSKYGGPSCWDRKAIMDAITVEEMQEWKDIMDRIPYYAKLSDKFEGWTKGRVSEFDPSAYRKEIRKIYSAKFDDVIQGIKDILK